MFAGFAVFAGLMTLLGVFAWLLRSMIDHQRWKRALKVQADAHTKLLERELDRRGAGLRPVTRGSSFPRVGALPSTRGGATSARLSGGFCGPCRWVW